ncbi:unnamed protein product [Parnassius apollo]|uniref:(apollo) hypothetical protein n=1 Tax=Parnassius apollo TaxID=110799 RepID=A0A8S3X402_PARAO|nr:unnamed protein product [Parnassius apollo]
MLSFDPQLNPHIVSCILENEWGETTSLKWDPMDFQHVHLNKNFEFNYHVDTIDIIADKAVIPRWSEWIYEYDSKAFRTNHGRLPVGPPPSTKSVIIHFLVSESFDGKEIINLIDKGVIPSDWRIIVVVPKEREFKQFDARCFGKMTFEMRAYLVITELNIAETIFTNIKHQSMTLNKDKRHPTKTTRTSYKFLE